MTTSIARRPVQAGRFTRRDGSLTLIGHTNACLTEYGIGIPEFAARTGVDPGHLRRVLIEHPPTDDELDDELLGAMLVALGSALKERRGRRLRLVREAS